MTEEVVLSRFSLLKESGEERKGIGDKGESICGIYMGQTAEIRRVEELQTHQQ